MSIREAMCNLCLLKERYHRAWPVDQFVGHSHSLEMGEIGDRMWNDSRQFVEPEVNSPRQSLEGGKTGDPLCHLG